MKNEARTGGLLLAHILVLVSYSSSEEPETIKSPVTVSSPPSRLDWSSLVKPGRVVGPVVSQVIRRWYNVPVSLHSPPPPPVNGISVTSSTSLEPSHSSMVNISPKQG